MSLSFRVCGVTLLGVTVAVSGCQHGAAPASAPKPTAGAPRGSTESARRDVPGTRAPGDSTPARPAGSPGPATPGGASAAGPRPYEQVVPNTARTSRGLFITHQVGTKVLFEIPRSGLNTDMLLVGRLVRAANGGGDYPGDEFLEQAMRWERREHKLFMRVPVFNVLSDSTTAVARAVALSNTAPIINVFDVLAYGPDSAAVIDVTALFLSSAEFSAVGGVDPARSFIDRVSAYPENVVIEATQTASGGKTATKTVTAHWDLIQLPKHPMMPRLADTRVGYFTIRKVDYGASEQRAVRTQFITRWRLEKKDPSAALSEPVKPIIYYIDPATPDYLKPFIKAGVESWQPAFEAAGFKHAILAKDVPVNDTTFSMEDVRNTVIRWLPSLTENAEGPKIEDPRTGEILNGSIRMFHNVTNLVRSWYFTQVAPLDPRVATWPFPDTLMGRLVQYVVAHELGHTLGFPHNLKASSTYPVDSLRSVSWLTKMGHVPSLMDYARFNYVVQPEDHIPAPLLIPRVGPYDKFATMWGYAPVPGAQTPEAERATLDHWARMQDSIPWYRYGRGAELGVNDNPDVGDAREAVGDADAVKATTLGITNLKRVIPMLIPAAVKSGEDYTELANMYGRVVDQWGMEVSHVVNIIGGVETYTKYGGQAGVIYTPVPRARQVAAMQFLRDQAFATPTFLLDPQILQRLDPEGGTARVLKAQDGVLRLLFSEARINRMAEFQNRAAHSSDVYTVNEMLRDLRNALWSELTASQVAISMNRRELQRSYLDRVTQWLTRKPATPQGPPPPETPSGPPPSGPPPRSLSKPGELVAGLRLELLDLQHQVDAALPRSANRETRAHLLDVAQQIQDMLHPK